MLLIPPRGGAAEPRARIPIVELMPYKLDTRTFKLMSAAAGHEHTFVHVRSRDDAVVREDLMPAEVLAEWRGMSSDQQTVELDTCRELVRWSVLCVWVRMYHDFHADVQAAVSALGVPTKG